MNVIRVIFCTIGVILIGEGVGALVPKPPEQNNIISTLIKFSGIPEQFAETSIVLGFAFILAAYFLRFIWTFIQRIMQIVSDLFDSDQN